jgi:hypothetical protein
MASADKERQGTKDRSSKPRPSKPRPKRRRETEAQASEEERDRPSVEELGGESEYSLGEAHRIERGSSRRHVRGASDPDPLSASPDPGELARRSLEDATQAAPRNVGSGEEEPVILPSDEP